jgi:phosphoenolpyruvate synthase/pyruvate phosphate dikinase
MKFDDDAYLGERKPFLEGTRPGHYYMAYILTHQYSVTDHPWPLGIRVMILSKDNMMYWIYMLEGMQEFHPFLDRIIKKPALLSSMKKYMDKKKDVVVNKFSSTNFSSLSNEKLMGCYNFFFKEFEDIMHTSATLRFIDKAVVDTLQNNIVDKPLLDKALQAITITSQMSYSSKEEITLLKLAADLKKKNKNADSEIAIEGMKNIFASFAWISCGYFDEKPKTISDYKKKIEEMISANPEQKLEDLLKAMAEEKIFKRSIQAKLGKQELKVFNIGSECTYLKDYLKFSLNKMIYFAEPIFDELVRRTGKDKRFIKELLPDEAGKFLSGKKIDEQMIAERRKKVILYARLKKFLVITGKEADRIENKYLQMKADYSELKGRVACSGTAEGTVAVVKSTNDFGKVKPGDVLVVSNTTPDYVPILRKVSAIIAEEGGLTAHVSVISREMKIPCLVGIKYATKILKDRDLVEVDANNGIVRKI